MRGRFVYFFSCTGKRLCGMGQACPSCGSTESTPVSRKYIVATLRRCDGCRLMFRSPTDSAEESFAYYQQDYDSGFTTELPGADELAAMLNSGFSETPKDFSRYLRILRALGIPEGARILDFGCSWGYGVWQFAQAGYDACGFELSVTRARFARNQLQVNVVSDVQELPEGLDVVFSSHVLEHIPQLGETVNLMFSRLRPGGLMLAITPNGSATYRAKRPDRWQRSWGLKHPLLLDAEYWRSLLGGRPHLVTSDLVDEGQLREWMGQGDSKLGPVDGPELLAGVRN